MPHAIILTTASKKDITGGAFADTLAANSGDSLAVANYDAGGARILEAWAMDASNPMELRFRYTRPESSHDQQQGIRFQVAATAPGAAGKQGARMLLPGYGTVPVYKSDAAIIDVSGTANDDVAISYLIEYDDLPGVSGQFASWEQVQAMRKSTIGVRCDAVASATEGAYGATRAINADDDRFHADSYYAILGITTQLPVLTVALTGPAWGGQKFGLPGDALNVDIAHFFVEQTVRYGRPLIPFFSANDKANVLVQVADTVASTSPKIDLLMAELTGRPG